MSGVDSLLRSQQNKQRLGGFMKSFIFAAVIALASGSVFASGDCHTGHDSNGNCGDDKYFTCYAQDGEGVTYKQESNGWLDKAVTQYRVFKKCKQGAANARTCKPLGCVDKY
jgi:hypothetical protein